MVQEHIHHFNHNYNKKIALFGDLHFSHKYPKKVLKNIIENINKNKPDYICIPGDIIDNAIALEDEKLVNELKQFLVHLSLIAPLILSYGNHDEVDIKFHKVTYHDTTFFFHELNKIPNIYFLDNTSIKLDKINFIGYHPNYSYFQSREKEPFQNINYIKKCIDSNCCNILLCHSPIKILDYELPVDFILSGHMHNGLVPNFLKKIGNNKGLVGPYHSFFPKLSRGVVTNKKTKLIITGGIRKISNSSSLLLRFLNLFYHIDIDYIEI